MSNFRLLNISCITFYILTGILLRFYVLISPLQGFRFGNPTITQGCAALHPGLSYYTPSGLNLFTFCFVFLLFTLCFLLSFKSVLISVNPCLKNSFTPVSSVAYDF
jgi:hypothetical protein